MNIERDGAAEGDVPTATVPRGRGFLATVSFILAALFVRFATDKSSIMNVELFVTSGPRQRMNTTTNITTNATAAEHEEQTGPPTTDFFVMLPGKAMDARNQKIFEATRSSILKFYPEERVHVVHNVADPTYLRRFPDESQRTDHVVQNDNFALGAFAAAADWMERNRPSGAFVILQHSVSLLAAAAPPACDVESVNTRQRCGEPCPPDVNFEMLTPEGAAACYPILNEVMGLYNATCGFPCCPFAERSDVHFDHWPLMAHNPVLVTPRAREFLRPMTDYVSGLPPGHVGKRGDMGTERLFGLFSSMLLQKYGPVYSKSIAVAGKNYSDALEAYNDKIFACSQDLTTKVHGNLSVRKRKSLPWRYVLGLFALVLFAGANYLRFCLKFVQRKARRMAGLRPSDAAGFPKQRRGHNE